MAKKGGQLQQSQGGGRGRFLGFQYWYSGQRNRGNHGTHRQPLCDIPVHEFHNIYAHDNPQPASERNTGAEVQYETVEDLNLSLQKMPSSGSKRSEESRTEGGHVYDNPNLTATSGESGAQQPSYSANVSESSSTGSSQPDHSPSLPTLQNARGGNSSGDSGSQSSVEVAVGKRQLQPESIGQTPLFQKQGAGKEGEGSVEGKPPTGGEGEKRVPNKKEKFVAKVIDETLESIVSQREALAATPELQGTEGQDSDAGQPRDQSSATDASQNSNMPRTSLAGSKDSLNVSDSSKNSSSEENPDRRRHRRVKHSSKHHKMTEDLGKVEKADTSEQDTYVSPKRRPPVSDSSNSKRSGRDDRDASLKPGKFDGAVWDTNVESSA